MDENLTVSQWIAGSVLLLLILYGFWNGITWLFVEVMHLTPWKLAMFSLFVIFTPIVLTLILFSGSNNAANSTVASVSIWVMPFGVLGLVVSGIWRLIS